MNERCRIVGLHSVASGKPREQARGSGPGIRVATGAIVLVDRLSCHHTRVESGERLWSALLHWHEALEIGRDGFQVVVAQFRGGMHDLLSHVARRDGASVSASLEIADNLVGR